MIPTEACPFPYVLQTPQPRLARGPLPTGTGENASKIGRCWWQDPCVERRHRRLPMMTFKALTTPAALLVTMTLLSAPAWAGQGGHRTNRSGQESGRAVERSQGQRSESPRAGTPRSQPRQEAAAPRSEQRRDAGAPRSEARTDA